MSTVGNNIEELINEAITARRHMFNCMVNLDHCRDISVVQDSIVHLEKAVKSNELSFKQLLDIQEVREGVESEDRKLQAIWDRGYVPTYIKRP